VTHRVPSSLSVIIPALNEAAVLEETLAAAGRAEGVEVIVVDGGSRDGTPEVAARSGARVVRARPERARQMNLGASLARGRILLFLHADTLLPDGYDEHLRRILTEPGVVAGAFRFGLRERRRGLGWVTAGARLRSRFFHLPYGDQALFLRREVFDRVGGFPEIPIMEDVVFVRRLRACGRIVIGSLEARTSARRYLRHGVLRTVLLHQLLLAGHVLGVSPSGLLRLRGGASAKETAESSAGLDQEREEGGDGQQSEEGRGHQPSDHHAAKSAIEL